MPWQVAVALWLLALGVFHGVLKSHLGGHLKASSFHNKFLVQFGFCLPIAITIAILYGDTVQLDWVALGIGLLGFANGFGAYCQWKATQINQSKNAIFAIFDDILAMALSYLVLHEGQHLNTSNMIGIAICILAVMWLFFIDLGKQKEQTPLRFYRYVIIYNLIWGVATFLQKYAAFHEVPIGKFLISWYSGALLASAVIFFLLRKRETQRLNRTDYLALLIMSICMVGIMTTQYEAYKGVPQIIIQPIFLVAAMVLPAAIGFYGFGEKKDFTTLEKLLLLTAIGGGILIAISYWLQAPTVLLGFLFT